jgi:lipopolysaccharide transport system permease protein
MSTVADRPQAPPETAPAAPSAAPVRVIEPWRPGVRHRLAESWRYRRMIPYYGRSFIKRRYRNTWLGWIWLPLRPALDTIGKAFLFGGLLSGAYYGKPAIIFIAFSGAGWLLFQRTSYWGARSMRVSRSFLKNAHGSWMPKLSAIIFPAGMDFLFSIAIAFGAVIYYWIARGTLYLTPQMGIGVLGILMLLLMGLGLGFCLAPFSQFTRDVRFSYVYLMQLWYYVTPIVYAASAPPAPYQRIITYNPLTAPVQLTQQGFLGAPGPVTQSLVSSFVFLVVILTLGLRMINRFECSAVGRL